MSEVKVDGSVRYRILCGGRISFAARGYERKPDQWIIEGPEKHDSLLDDLGWKILDESIRPESPFSLPAGHLAFMVPLEGF